MPKYARQDKVYEDFKECCTDAESNLQQNQHRDPNSRKSITRSVQQIRHSTENSIFTFNGYNAAKLSGKNSATNQSNCMLMNHYNTQKKDFQSSKTFFDLILDYSLWTSGFRRIAPFFYR